MHAYIPVKAYWKAVEKCDFMSYFSNCADQGNLSASKSCVYAGVVMKLVRAYCYNQGHHEIHTSR